MPTYQYACTECGHAFEQVQSFTDDALTECPECEGRLRKVFNAVGVVFKGSGFYRTDSRAKESSSETSDSPAAKTDAEPDRSHDVQVGRRPAVGLDSSSSGRPRRPRSLPSRPPAEASPQPGRCG